MTESSPTDQKNTLHTKLLLGAMVHAQCSAVHFLATLLAMASAASETVWIFSAPSSSMVMLNFSSSAIMISTCWEATSTSGRQL